jgi:putative pyruvate formate lyase activating enzyme
MGKCGLKEKAYCSPPFIHICEEPPVTPAINTKMFGCGMRCIYCQAYEHIEGWQTNPELMELDQKVWGLMEWKRPNAIEFVGGDPTVSLAGILDFLACAPRGFSLPVIWDDSSYGSGKTYNLLEGVVDVWLPDFRYGNNACAKRLSGVDHYWETATAALQIMMKQNARTIVRILVLPSHVRCCNIRVLEWLSQFRDRIWISVLDQYIPEWKAAGHREIGRTPTKEEIMEVKEVVRRFGLRDVNESPEGFWR